MMNKPALNDMIDKVGCRYMLVTAVAKRARQLLEDPEKLDDAKPVSMAVEEIDAGKVSMEFSEAYLQGKL